MTPDRRRLRTIAQRALERFGWQNQTDQAIEELAELMVAIRHYRRGRITERVLISEVADVRLMIEQLIQHFGEREYEECLDESIAKLERKLSN